MGRCVPVAWFQRDQWLRPRCSSRRGLSPRPCDDLQECLDRTGIATACAVLFQNALRYPRGPLAGERRHRMPDLPNETAVSVFDQAEVGLPERECAVLQRVLGEADRQVQRARAECDFLAVFEGAIRRNRVELEMQ